MPGPRIVGTAPADGWVAACMEPDEWDHWVRNNPHNASGGRIERPCSDCPMGFAADMRAIGRCNGQPGQQPFVGLSRHEEEEEEDDEVIDQRSSGGVRAATALELTPPACGTCQHEPICVLKVALTRAKSAEVTMAPLPEGLTVAVSARVDCRFYNSVKKSRQGAGGGAWSDERRAAHSERMKARSAAGFTIGQPKAVA